jgi:hypothetical protein
MKQYSVIFLLLFATSCINDKTSYEKALDLSKDNRDEIETILQYYSNIEDTAKLKAAIFLVENMIDKESVVNLNKQNKDSLLSYIRNLNDPISWDPQHSILVKTIDSVLLKFPHNYTILSDLEIIKANQIIENINSTFEVWEKSKWKNNYSINDLHNYVLPYKIDSEEIDNWRCQALKDVAILEDSIRNNSSIYDYGRAMANHSFIRYNIGMDHFYAPFMFSDIKRAGVGSCIHAAYMTVYYNRSRGIPSAIDLIPAWANRKGSHMWSSVILPGNKSKGIYFNGEGENDFQYKISKIYRKTYETQLKIEPKFGENIPKFFANRNIIDVTDEYNMPLSTVMVNIKNDRNVNYVYLSTFNNREWIPVAYAEKNNAIFENIGVGLLPRGNNRMKEHINQGSGIVYLPVYSLWKGVSPAANPLILDTCGSVTEIIPSSKKEKIRLFRKYPKNSELAYSENALVGAVIEAANKLDFSDSKIIGVIERAQTHPLEMIKIENDETFRYIRFTPLHGVIASIAELQFFDNTGKRILGNAINGKEIFDGNLLTWYYKGMNYTEHFIYDFEKARHISEIKFSSRTDDNEIMKGEEYELFYWNDKWISLGRRIASEYYLDYEVPQKALFLLRNHTKGVEERIFTIENGKQIWW